jgi:hypothetical protein
VIVDAVSGAVIEWFAENNPEEWAASSDARGAEAGSAQVASSAVTVPGRTSLRVLYFLSSAN